jgi:hypothetical protein
MLQNSREIPGIDPLATLLASYEMLGLVFRNNAEARAKISREVTHGGIDPRACAGDAKLVPRMARLPKRAFHLFAAWPGLPHCSLHLGLGLSHLLRLIANLIILSAGNASPVLLSPLRTPLRHHRPPVAVTRRMCRGHDSASKSRPPGRKVPRDFGYRIILIEDALCSSSDEATMPLSAFTETGSTSRSVSPHSMNSSRCGSHDKLRVADLVCDS